MGFMYLNKTEDEALALEARFDDGGRPVVRVGGQFHRTLADLLAAHPELGKPECLPLYCDLCIHLSNGPGCFLIQDPDEFRSRYQALVLFGMEYASDLPSAADFGPFDVTEIGPPRIVDRTLVCYAEDGLYGVPYRVEAPWPHRADEPVKFLLLPLED